MNLRIAIVGLPNAGPSRTLAVPVVYVHASRCRVYGTAQSIIARMIYYFI